VRLDGLAESDSELLGREISENGSNLSGGERQRLALARLFLRQPTLIVLDEPTTGLDSETERTIFSAIRWFSRSVTLIVVTHREELARDADHIIRLSPEGVTVESQKTESSARAPV
jgi:ATP-binding cassette subfamily C protein CydD